MIHLAVFMIHLAGVLIYECYTLQVFFNIILLVWNMYYFTNNHICRHSNATMAYSGYYNFKNDAGRFLHTHLWKPPQFEHESHCEERERKHQTWLWWPYQKILVRSTPDLYKCFNIMIPHCFLAILRVCCPIR